MHSKKIGVGIIGASGWGKVAHIPALQALPKFEIVAVSTTKHQSAEDIARHFGIPHFYTDPHDLVSNPEVDVVVITVRVPKHNELVRLALHAGKHVYCEWPLALDADEADAMLRLADAKGVRHITGLQARANPTLHYMKDLLQEGYLGDVLSININYSMPAFPTKGKTIDQAHAYLLDKKNGANQLTITAGHLLDGITYVIDSSFSNISAELETQYKEIQVIETYEIIQATAPDYVAISGRLNNGALLTGQFRNSNRLSLTITIVGTKGELSLQSKDGLMFQWDSFSLQADFGDMQGLQSLTVPDHYYVVNRQDVSGVSYNISQLYTQFANDLKNSTYTVPDFQTGLKLHHLLEHIMKAAETGTVQYITD